MDIEKTEDYWKRKYELLEKAIGDLVPQELVKEITRRAAGHAGGKAYPKKDEVSKPEVTEDYVRIPVNDCKVTATIDIDRSKGIKALYCGDEKQVGTYLFPSDDFTMESAREWISAHKSDDPELKCERCGSLSSEVKQMDRHHNDGNKENESKSNVKNLCSVCHTHWHWENGKSHPPRKTEKSYEVPICKIDEEKRLVYGIVMEPDSIDSQGDWESAEEIERAAHKFMKDSRVIYREHKTKQPNVHVVESYIAQDDSGEIKKGSWVMVTYCGDEEMWKQVKKGEFTGYSIRGYAQRQ